MCRSSLLTDISDSVVGAKPVVTTNGVSDATSLQQHNGDKEKENSSPLPNSNSQHGQQHMLIDNALVGKDTLISGCLA